MAISFLRMTFVSVLSAVGFCACSGGGASAPSGAGQPVAIPHTQITPSGSLQMMTYRAPYGGQGAGNTIFLLAANGCGDISASPGSPSAFPANIVNGSLKSGTIVSVTGLATDTNGSVVSLGCPTGGIVAQSVTVAGTAYASMTYTAPYGGLGAGNSIFLMPANGCGYIPSTPGSTTAFPAGLTNGTLKSGTVISITGHATDWSGKTIVSGCPSGGIVAASISIAGAAAPSPAPSPVSSSVPSPVPSPAPSSIAVPAQTMTYTAPFGGQGNGNAIFLMPANGCGYIPSTPGSATAFPVSIATGSLKSGTVISITGHATDSSGKVIVSGCPSGGIIATSIAISATAPVTTPTAAPPSGAAVVSCVTLDVKYNRQDLPACFQPYTSTSPWNQPLPAAPRSLGSSQAIMDFLFSSPFSTGMNTPRIGSPYYPDVDYGFPYYFSSASDPLVTLHCNAPWGRCAFEGMQIHIPASAKPAPGGGDHHLTVVDVTTATEYDFYVAPASVPASGGSYTVEWGGMTNLRTGTGWEGSGTAAGSSQLGGIVRVSEFQAGIIKHALSMSTSCTLENTQVYPATANAIQTCPGGAIGSTAAIGSRLWLDLTPDQIAALHVSNPTKIVLNALHSYGGFVTDTNGNDTSLAINGIPESPTSFIASNGTDTVGAWYAANMPAYPWRANTYQLDIWGAVDWQHHLHVLDPCVTRQSC